MGHPAIVVALYWSGSVVVDLGAGCGAGLGGTGTSGRLLRRKATRSLIWSSVNWLPKAGMASLPSWIWVAISWAVLRLRTSWRAGPIPPPTPAVGGQWTQAMVAKSSEPRSFALEPAWTGVFGCAAIATRAAVAF